MIVAKALCAALLLALSARSAGAQTTPAAFTAPARTNLERTATGPDAIAMPLVGALTDKAAWRDYKSRFISEQGRVIDTANGGISHSEGQGYGMLLAVAADDRAGFDALWGWTRANLMVRDDELIAWRWEPDKRPAVADMNDAADGDLLVAWALT
jgi:endoglucanase